MSAKHATIGRSLAAALAAWAALSVAPPLAAQQNWPPIPPEDAAMTDCPGQPGAAAVCLFREEIIDHDIFQIKVFKRIKVLTAAGRDQANIEIPYHHGIQLVKDIEARVVPPQSPPRPFAGQIFDKTAIRGRGIRVSVKSFALPDVEPGDIIDYRYRIVPDWGGSSGRGSEEALADLRSTRTKPEEGGIADTTDILSIPAVRWDVQDDLFTKRAKFSYVSSPFIWGLFRGFGRLAWAGRVPGDSKPVIKGGRIELEVENVPAFEEEDFMPPEEVERISMDIYYLDGRITSHVEYWKRESKSWQKAAEKFLGDPRKLSAEAIALTGDLDDPQARLQKIYERAQGIRNLSYEKGLTRGQRKEQKIKDNRRVADVLERGYGLRSDITRVFVSLARAAGFEAEVARVMTRDDKLFRDKHLSFYSQLDSEVALVVLEGKTVLFDPATPFCPFGLIHWTRSNSAAVRFSTSPPAWFTTSVYPPDLALTQREVVLKVDADGSLDGTVKTTYTGHEALVRRLDHIHDDREEIRKRLEGELTDLLPMGAEVTMTGLENIDNNEPAVVVLCNVSIPGLAASAGDRMLLPASPLIGKGRHPFRHAERRYPVYFPYPYREFNDIIITLPEGMAVETRPEPNKIRGDFSSYSLVCVQEEPRKLHVQRDLVIQKSYFSLDQYPDLKAFYDAVRAGDTTYFVLAVTDR